MLLFQDGLMISELLHHNHDLLLRIYAGETIEDSHAIQVRVQLLLTCLGLTLAGVALHHAPGAGFAVDLDGRAHGAGRMRGLVDAGADANKQDKDGGTALMIAAKHGGKHGAGMMRALVDAGADANKQTEHGW